MRSILRAAGLAVLGAAAAAAPSAAIGADAPGKPAEAPKTGVATAKAADPASVLKGIKVPAGFDLKLFAAPPNVGYPTCLAASPTGEIFVGIDENGSLDQKPDRGRIVRCIDTDGDGAADQFVTFAKMDSPRGIVVDGGTVYVLHPPFLTAYHDDNGDGVSDRSENLIAGLAHDLKFRGADHTTNGIQMGIDGWLYIACGDYGAINAVGADGKTLQLHGGGIVRVRPDGSEMELYARGTRNIYDVAIDPLMNVFTRDNTNDGDGWNDRLSYIVEGANYGYPSLFVHFGDEIVQPLADYGGGSPCGSLFLDEPALGAYGRGLFTCEWGNNGIFRHPLKENGAGFKAEQKKIIDITRPTDMDVDAAGRIYIASWKGATFNYAGPNAGFVVRVSDPNAKAEPYPDMAKAPQDDLVKFLASASGIWRIHAQHEILRRGDKPQMRQALLKVAQADGELPARAAAIFTLKQLAGKDATDALVQLAKVDVLRELALRALADRLPQCTDVPLAPFTAALHDPNPRVRTTALVALGRLGRMEAAADMALLVADADPLVAHSAVQALAKLEAAKACLDALDNAAPAVVAGAGKALQLMHKPEVVDGLIHHLQATTDPATRQVIYKTLCRLAFKEADWDGKWWGTRPDTSGPYFKPVEWEGSAKIQPVLREALKNERPETLGPLIVELQRNKVDVPGMQEILIKQAQSNPALKPIAVDYFDAKPAAVDADALKLLEGIASSADQPPAQRVKALRVLGKAGAAGRDAAVRQFAANAREKSPREEIARALSEFARDSKRAEQVAIFTKLAAGDDAAVREVAFAVLVDMGANQRMNRNAREQATAAIAAAWGKPELAASVLRAIGREHAKGYQKQVETALKSADAAEQEAAAFAAEQLGMKIGKGGAPLISTLKPDDVAAQATSDNGDAALGKTLFARQTCVNCHTVSADEAPKGPFLGGIGTRYSKAELLESILKPSAKIAQGFETQWFEKADGTEVDGFVVHEAGDQVEIRTATGERMVLAKADIKERGKRETSIMPTGVVDNCTVHDLASIVAYLESLKAK